MNKTKRNYEKLDLRFDRSTTPATLTIEFNQNAKNHTSVTITVGVSAKELIPQDYYNPPGFNKIRAEVNAVAAALLPGEIEYLSLRREKFNNINVRFYRPGDHGKELTYNYDTNEATWGHESQAQLPEEFTARVEPQLSALFNKIYPAKERKETITLKQVPETHPLISAVRQENWNEVSRLVSAGENPNIRAGETIPLTDTIMRNAPEATVQKLLTAGAAFNFGFDNYKTSGVFIYQALKNKYRTDVIELMLARHADPYYFTANLDESTLVGAYATGRFDVVTALVKAGLDVNNNVYQSKDPTIDSIFYQLINESRYRMEEDFPQLVDILLAHGADPNQVSYAHGARRSPLHAAVHNTSLELVETLIKGGGER